MLSLLALSVVVAAAPCKRPIVHGQPAKSCPEPAAAVALPVEQTATDAVHLAPLTLIERDELSEPPIVALDDEPRSTSVPMDRAALELAAAKRKAEGARQKAALPDDLESETNVEVDANPNADARAASDAAFESSPESETPELIEPAKRRNPLPIDHAPEVRRPNDEWDKRELAPTAGPTGAIYVGVSMAENSNTGSGSFGGMLGVRFFPKSAPATALSVLVSGRFGSRGIELGLPLRAELIGIKEGAQVPSVRMGAMLTPFLVLGQSGAPNLAGGRASLTLGWCLPAAFARGPADPPSEDGAPAVTDFRFLNALAGLGSLGGGGAALLVLLAALVVMTPDLSLGYEVTSEPGGFSRSAVHFSVGIGI